GTGIHADARRDAPFAPYDRLGVRVPVYETSDVWARTVLRLDEARESVRLITAILDGLESGSAQTALGALRAGADATVVVEAWRGPIWYWVLAAGPAGVA